MSLSTYKYGAPGGAPRLQLPGRPADHDQRGDLVETDRHRVGHGPQPADVLGYAALFDGHPLRSLHAGQAGGFLERQTGRLAGFLDAGAEQPAHALAEEIGRRKGGEHFQLCTHTLMLLLAHIVK